MSEEKFKEAKSDLAFSQQLRDSLRGQNMAQPQAEMEESPEEMPMEEAPVEEVEASEEEKGVLETIQEAVRPMFEELKEMFSEKEKEPKEVEIKIEGEMQPKEDNSEK